MIDTVRYANRLKAAGVEGPLAEEMSQALDDELVASLLKKGPEEAGRKTTAFVESFDEKAARWQAEADVWERKSQFTKDQYSVIRRVLSRQLDLPEPKARYNPLALWREIRAEYKRLRKEMKALATIDKDWVKDKRFQIKSFRGLYFMAALVLAMVLYVWVPAILANPVSLIFLGALLFIPCAFWAYANLHFLD